MSVTLTSNYSFHKYDDGDMGWGAGICNNFDRLDAYLYELYNRRLPSWLTGTSMPDAGVGLSGDMYVITNDSDHANNGKVYQKVGNYWNYKARIQGPTGSTGAAGATGATGTGIPGLSGTQWFYYVGSPASDIGRPGDFSLDTSNGDVYVKDSNGWVKQASLLGPQGMQGPPGVQGLQSPTMWYADDGPPLNIGGQNGNFYLDKLNGNLYVKLSNAWQLIPLTAGGGSALLEVVAKYAGTQIATLLFDQSNGAFHSADVKYEFNSFYVGTLQTNNTGVLSPNEVQMAIDANDTSLIVQRTDLTNGDVTGLPKPLFALEPAHGGVHSYFALLTDPLADDEEQHFSFATGTGVGGIVPVNFSVAGGDSNKAHFIVRVYETQNDQLADSPRAASAALPTNMNIVEIKGSDLSFHKSIISIANAGEIFVTVKNISGGTVNSTTVTFQYRYIWKDAFSGPAYASETGSRISFNNTKSGTVAYTILADVGMDTAANASGGFRFNWYRENPFNLTMTDGSSIANKSFNASAAGLYRIMCDVSNDVVWDRLEGLIVVYSTTLPFTAVTYSATPTSLDTTYWGEPSLANVGKTAVYAKFAGTSGDQLTITVTPTQSTSFDVYLLDSTKTSLVAWNSNVTTMTENHTLASTEDFYIEIATRLTELNTFALTVVKNN